MRIILNFIASILFIEVGFFLIFGNDINMDDMYKNLNNYQNDNIPVVGTEVELYIVDISNVFLKNNNYASIMYDTECYYIAQINDGRFIVLKTSEGSNTDEKIKDFSKKCNDFYFFKKGSKPDILYIKGKIDKVPNLDSGNYEDYLNSATREMMPARGYVRMDVSEIVVNADYNVSGSDSMDGVLKQSINIIASVANALKKVLGGIVILMGIALVIGFIRDILNGISYDTKHVIVAGDDVFGNIASIKKYNGVDTQDNKEDDEKDKETVKLKVKAKDKDNKGLKLKK